MKFKSWVVVILALLVGLVGRGFVADFLREREKDRIEASLFPHIRKNSIPGRFQCNPQFVVTTKSTLSVYCEAYGGDDRNIREQLRSNILDEVKNWAQNEGDEDRFITVGFMDEVVLRGKK